MISTRDKVLIGAIGGLSAVCVKFLGQDYNIIVENIANLTASQMLSYKIGYIILTPILMFLGGALASVIEEKNKLKLFAIGVAAPALITTWSGGNKNELNLAGLPAGGGVISAAYADTKPDDTPWYNFTEKDPDEIDEKSMIGHALEGVKMFFGYGNKPKKYWVVVGSYKNKRKAEKVVKKINRSKCELGAFVGKRLKQSGYYPVVVGDYQTLDEARDTRDKALSLSIIDEAFLTPAKLD